MKDIVLIHPHVTAIAPATVANVSCGFDILGFAVNEPFDEVSLEVHEGGDVQIADIIGGHGKLPREASKNTSGVAVQAYLKALKLHAGVRIVLRKNLPLGSGMGSSAASAVAALVAINFAYGEPLSKMELLPFAMQAEKIACGAGHADNAAPSLLGGMVLVRSYDPLDVVSVPLSAHIFCTLIHPHLELNTVDSRSVLKTQLSLSDAVKQWGNVAGLITGLMKPDYDLISRSLTDVVAEPLRGSLIPGFAEIKKAAVRCGALGAGISGSGPTIYALSKSAEEAHGVATAVREIFLCYDLESDVFVSPVNAQGAQVTKDTRATTDYQATHQTLS